MKPLTIYLMYQAPCRQTLGSITWIASAKGRDPRRDVGNRLIQNAKATL